MSDMKLSSKFVTNAVIVCFIALVAVPLLLYQREAFLSREILDDQGKVVGHEYNASASPYRDRYMKAASLLNERKDAAAESVYRKLAELEPSSSAAFIGLAGAQLGQLNLDGARENYAKAQQLEPTNPEAFYGAGAVERTAGNLQTAKEYYQQALSISPDHGLSHFGMAKTCNELGDKQLASYHATRFLELFPDSALRSQILEMSHQH